MAKSILICDDAAFMRMMIKDIRINAASSQIKILFAIEYFNL